VGRQVRYRIDLIDKFVNGRSVSDIQLSALNGRWCLNRLDITGEHFMIFGD
jgi:hypothetical protein